MLVWFPLETSPRRPAVASVLAAQWELLSETDATAIYACYRPARMLGGGRVVCLVSAPLLVRQARCLLDIHISRTAGCRPCGRVPLAVATCDE